ncbi:MAG: DUF4274 domain-containing protein [Planctomycetota bacterium]
MSALTPEQRERIAILVSYEWVCDIEGQPHDENERQSDENLAHLLSKCESALELHEMVLEISKGDCWEDAGRVLLNHPFCDYATWLAAFWRLAPSWFEQFVDESELMQHGYHDKRWDFIRKAEAWLCSSDRSSAQLHFDPTNDDGIDWTREYSDRYHPEGFYKIPDILKQPI